MAKLPKVEEVQNHVSSASASHCGNIWTDTVFGVTVFSYKVILWLWSPFMNQNAMSWFQVGLLVFKKDKDFTLF